jgi:hypothetical protein
MQDCWVSFLSQRSVSHRAQWYQTIASHKQAIGAAVDANGSVVQVARLRHKVDTGLITIISLDIENTTTDIR